MTLAPPIDSHISPARLSGLHGPRRQRGGPGCCSAWFGQVVDPQQRRTKTWPHRQPEARKPSDRLTLISSRHGRGGPTDPQRPNNIRTNHPISPAPSRARTKRTAIGLMVAAPKEARCRLRACFTWLNTKYIAARRVAGRVEDNRDHDPAGALSVVDAVREPCQRGLPTKSTCAVARSAGPPCPPGRPARRRTLPCPLRCPEERAVASRSGPDHTDGTSWVVPRFCEPGAERFAGCHGAGGGRRTPGHASTGARDGGNGRCRGRVGHG